MVRNRHAWGAFDCRCRSDGHTARRQGMMRAVAVKNGDARVAEVQGSTDKTMAPRVRNHCALKAELCGVKPKDVTSRGLRTHTVRTGCSPAPRIAGIAMCRARCSSRVLATAKLGWPRSVAAPGLSNRFGEGHDTGRSAAVRRKLSLQSLGIWHKKLVMATNAIVRP